MGAGDGTIIRRPLPRGRSRISFLRDFVFEEDRELQSEEDVCPDCGGLGGLPALIQSDFLRATFADRITYRRPRPAFLQRSGVSA